MNIWGLALARNISFSCVLRRLTSLPVHCLGGPFPSTVKQDNSIWPAWQEILKQGKRAMQVAQCLWKINPPESYFHPSENSIQLHNERASLGWCLSHQRCEVHGSPGVSVKCRFWVSGSRWGLMDWYFYQIQ